MDRIHNDDTHGDDITIIDDKDQSPAPGEPERRVLRFSCTQVYTKQKKRVVFPSHLTVKDFRDRLKKDFGLQEIALVFNAKRLLPQQDELSLAQVGIDNDSEIRVVDLLKARESTSVPPPRQSIRGGAAPPGRVAVSGSPQVPQNSPVHSRQGSDLSQTFFDDDRENWGDASYPNAAPSRQSLVSTSSFGGGSVVEHPERLLLSCKLASAGVEEFVEIEASLDDTIQFVCDKLKQETLVQAVRLFYYGRDVTALDDLNVSLRDCGIIQSCTLHYAVISQEEFNAFRQRTNLIHVHCSHAGFSCGFKVSQLDTVSTVKIALAKWLTSQFPDQNHSYLHLFYGDTRLEDLQTLQSCGVVEGGVLRCSFRRPLSHLWWYYLFMALCFAAAITLPLIRLVFVGEAIAFLAVGVAALCFVTYRGNVSLLASRLLLALNVLLISACFAILAVGEAPIWTLLCCLFFAFAPVVHRWLISHDQKEAGAVGLVMVLLASVALIVLTRLMMGAFIPIHPSFVYLVIESSTPFQMLWVATYVVPMIVVIVQQLQESLRPCPETQPGASYVSIQFAIDDDGAQPNAAAIVTPSSSQRFDQSPHDYSMYRMNSAPIHNQTGKPPPRSSRMFRSQTPEIGMMQSREAKSAHGRDASRRSGAPLLSFGAGGAPWQGGGDPAESHLSFPHQRLVNDASMVTQAGDGHDREELLLVEDASGPENGENRSFLSV